MMIIEVNCICNWRTTPATHRKYMYVLSFYIGVHGLIEIRWRNCLGP